MFSFKIGKEVVNPRNAGVNIFGKGRTDRRMTEKELEEMLSYRIVQIAVYVPALFEFAGELLKITGGSFRISDCQGGYLA